MVSSARVGGVPECTALTQSTILIRRRKPVSDRRTRMPAPLWGCAPIDAWRRRMPRVCGVAWHACALAERCRGIRRIAHGWPERCWSLVEHEGQDAMRLEDEAEAEDARRDESGGTRLQRKHSPRTLTAHACPRHSAAGAAGRASTVADASRGRGQHAHRSRRQVSLARCCRLCAESIARKRQKQTPNANSRQWQNKQHTK